MQIESISKAENCEIIIKKELKREYSKLISELKDGGHALIKIETDTIKDRLLCDIGNNQITNNF